MGIFSPPILKFWSDLCVCAPQYLFAGTRTTPMESDSSRHDVSLLLSETPLFEWRCEPWGTTRLSCGTPASGRISSRRREPTPAGAGRLPAEAIVQLGGG